MKPKPLKSIRIDSKTVIFVPLDADEETERQRFFANQRNKKNRHFIKTGRYE